MLNSGTKLCALRYKKKNILTLVLSVKKILNETNNHNPPFKLNGRSLNTICGRIMIGLSLSSISKHNMWSYYDWVVVVVFRQ
jgi:hypothetical protein